jgi:hypothetical protein
LTNAILFCFCPSSFFAAKSISKITILYLGGLQKLLEDSYIYGQICKGWYKAVSTTPVVTIVVGD